MRTLQEIMKNEVTLAHPLPAVLDLSFDDLAEYYEEVHDLDIMVDGDLVEAA